MSFNEIMVKRDEAFTEYLYCEGIQMYAAAAYYRNEYNRLNKILLTYGRNEEL